MDTTCTRHYAGIIVLRPRDQVAATLAAVLTRVLRLLDVEALAGALWVADEYRVRIRR